ncbi:hypothetical protein K440DRAFT_636151 [Wilcoxina mikolae CBS 423.85]|nr:hypothetical protein K440DRAFT_636151 [Wilcoxina mikolae CBS 423.85]
MKFPLTALFLLLSALLITAMPGARDTVVIQLKFTTLTRFVSTTTTTTLHPGYKYTTSTVTVRPTCPPVHTHTVTRIIGEEPVCEPVTQRVTETSWGCTTATDVVVAQETKTVTVAAVGL